MATVMKKRSLVNSGRFSRRKTKKRYKKAGITMAIPHRSGTARKRRKNSGRKKMTAKQIKYFGTARQRAALRSRGTRKRKRNYGTREGRTWSSFGSPSRARKKRTSKRTYSKAYKASSKGFRIGNSGRRRRRTRIGNRRRRRNVGQIFSIGLAGLAGGNPGRKKRTHKRRSPNMARRRTRRTGRRANAGHRTRRYTRRRRRTSNPSSYRRRRRIGNRRTSHRRRRNPGIGGAISSSTGLLKNALGVIGGAVAARYATQLALGGKNTGAIGYLGNAIASLALGWIAKKYLGPQVGTMVTLGGFTGLALRMLNDLTPIGQYVNLSLSGAGKAGDTGIGLITDTTFYVPTVFNSGSMSDAMIPNQVRQLVAAGSVNKGGMGSFRRRRMAA